MDNYKYISVFAPVGDAVERTKRILFRPFDIAKWFTIGFCAWLATLGEQGGFNGCSNFSNSNNYNSGNCSNSEFSWESVQSYLAGVEPVYFVIAGTAIFLIIAISILVAWLSSRGKFMFMHCIAKDVAEVSLPWRETKLMANSLFLFRLILGFAGFLIIAAVAIPSVILIVKNADYLNEGGSILYLSLNMAGIGILALAVALPLILAKIFTNSFVIPIMYKHNLRCTDAWRYFLSLLKVNKWNFTKFLLGRLLLEFGTGLIVLALILATCCTFGCLTALPYIGAVAILPFTVFWRSYSVLYLAQYGKELDCFLPIIDEDL